jgi:membrane protein insertase Oxa1/YidC/SpoIIIJ
MPDKEGGESQDAYQKNMKVVAVCILVMGVSIAIVVVMYLAFGHIGSTFSTGVMSNQQDKLRMQYDLPPCKPVPKSLAEVPPSLRNETGLCGSTP